VVLAGAGVILNYWGYLDWQEYYDERYDLDRISQLKSSSQLKYYAGYGCYAAAGISAGLSLYMFISRRAKLRVQDRVALTPTLNGAALSVRF
jgi:hypothetical protein